VRRTIGFPGTAAGSSFQQARLTAADGAASDQFGVALAIYGSTAVVGAPGKNSYAGAAHVFTSSHGTWTQRAELTAVGSAAGDSFGWSVALYRSAAVVGAPGSAAMPGAVYVFTGSGSTWTQRAKLTAVGGVPSDNFGSSLTLNGSTAVVGAPSKSTSTGAVYVFTGSGSTWTQRTVLTAADGAAHDQFGFSVALSGSTALIGAPGKSSNARAAYVFTGSGGTWNQRTELTASDAATGDLFGWAVARYGATAVVGAGGKNSGTGAVYLYSGSGSTWTQQAELMAPDGAPGDLFGASVAISGSCVVVGRPEGGTGAAYVFTPSGSTWTQQTELTAADGLSGQDFGGPVAISGSTALVSSFDDIFTLPGAAYVFVLPSQQARLTAADGAAGDQLGYSVAVSGSTAVVGAPGKNTGAGAAYVFTGSRGTWSQRAELTAADHAPGDEFGSAVALYGSTLVVGAPGKNTNTGAAYVFTGSGATWTQRAKLTAGDAAAHDQFGYSAAIYGSTVVVGAPFKNNWAGAAYVYTGSGTSWPQQAKLTAADTAQGDAFGSAVALSGSTMVVGAPAKNTGTGAAYVFSGSGGA
jgi:hypothetical protein